MHVGKIYIKKNDSTYLVGRQIALVLLLTKISPKNLWIELYNDQF